MKLWYGRQATLPVDKSAVRMGCHVQVDGFRNFTHLADSHAPGSGPTDASNQVLTEGGMKAVMSKLFFHLLPGTKYGGWREGLSK